MEMKILTPEEIQKPVARVKIETGETEKDWQGEEKLLGGTEERVVLFPDRNLVQYITEYEFQQQVVPGIRFDQFSCVTQGSWNGYQLIINRLFKVKLNKSKRYTAVKGGTVPRRGASITNILESIRKEGCVDDEVWPTMTPTMTEAEWYRKIPAEIDAKENFLKEGYVTNHEWIPRQNVMAEASLSSQVWEFMKYSPILAAVDGDYHFTPEGYLAYSWEGAGATPGWAPPFIEYNHVLLIVGGEYGKYLLALDSENPKGLMKIEWAYKLGSPKALYVKKNPMTRLIKTASSPAVFLHSLESSVRWGLGDSKSKKADGTPMLTGGAMLKTLSGTYKNANITVVGEEEMNSIPYAGLIQAE